MSDLHRAERKGRKVECPTCDEPLVVRSLRSHLTSQHDQYQYFLAPEVGEEGAETPTGGRRSSTRRRESTGAPCPIACKGRRE